MKVIDLNLDKKLNSLYKIDRYNIGIDRKLFEYYFSDRNLFLRNGLEEVGLGLLLTIFDLIDWDNPKSQILIITPTKKLALQVEEIFSSIGKDISIDFTALSSSNHKSLKNNLGRIIIGTPREISAVFENYPDQLTEVRQTFCINFYEILENGYATELKKVLKNLSSRIIIVSDRSNRKLEQFLSENIRKIDFLSRRGKFTRDTEYSKPKSLLQYLEILKNKKVLIIVKKKKHISLIKEYFSSHNFQVSDNYDLAIDYLNNNLIYLSKKAIIKDLKPAQFDFIFNYNVKDLHESVAKLGKKSQLPLSGIKDETVEKLDNFIEKTKQNLKEKVPVEKIVNAYSKSPRKTLADSSIEVSKTQELREVVLESVLPSVEVIDR